jgi:ATP phosphoribosyltransferase regulatory subunit
MRKYQKCNIYEEDEGYMKKWNIYTPDGVQDILFEECGRKRKLEGYLRALFQSCGYLELETPTLEFYDVFSGEDALLAQEKMFKFSDAKGRIIVLKPDMTIPVARVAATRVKDAAYPLKYCYIGNTFKANELGGGRQHECTEAGVELLGVNSPEADAEVIATAVRAVLATGVEEFQIDIGQVEFFRGIMEESGLSADEIEEVRHLIDRKDYVEVEIVMNRHSVAPELKALILDLPKLFGSKDILNRVATSAKIGIKAEKALNWLKEVLDILEDRGLSKFVSVDLGMVQSMGYYTGIVFRGYTYGIGFPILSGGRYDSLVSRFGVDCPATGFSLVVNFIMMALERQHRTSAAKSGGVLVTYDDGGRKAASRFCEELEKTECFVELDISRFDDENAREYAKKRGYEKVVRVIADGETRVMKTLLLEEPG